MDTFDIEVEARVERVVDVPADCVVSVPVGRLRVGHQVKRVEYRAYRREQGGDPNTDSAADLAATFKELEGHEAWAQRIGNGNRTSTHKGAPLKAYAIETEAERHD